MSSKLSAFLYADEKSIIEELLYNLSWDDDKRARIHNTAIKLVQDVRTSKRNLGELESFLQQYGLNTEEGLALMTLAEALLRIPDARTAIDLINDKMSAAEWLSKQGQTKDIMVRAAGWGLTLTQKTLDSAMSRVGEPVIRKAMEQAIRMLGKKFVLGQDIEDGVKTARFYEKKGYCMSYDMLGEGARTDKDAERYYKNYVAALEYIGKNVDKERNAGLSVKLSAIHPRYEYRKKDTCVPELIDRLTSLCRIAAANDIALTVDAEEVDRLEISLEIIEALIADKSLNNWTGFGIAVQAYQKRSLALIEHFGALAREHNRHIQIRLVKGAYWDMEIKRAQLMGLDEYPVFTRKSNTDLSYITCAQHLMQNRDVFYPMFATHNAHTIATILEIAGNDNGYNDNNGSGNGSFEFQRLHGMGEILHDAVMQEYNVNIRIYAPCGSHEELLPYLVRRLLENGASTSFVHKILDDRIPPEDIIADPVVDVRGHETTRHPKIPLPANIYPDRLNSQGMDLTEDSILTPLIKRIEENTAGKTYIAAPVVNGKLYQEGSPADITNPADKTKLVGHAWGTSDELINSAFQIAQKGYEEWRHVNVEKRAEILEKLAILLEDNKEELIGLCVLEAGKTLDDSVAEIREAIDFCRYYAMRGRIDFSETGQVLPGPTGETNTLKNRSRGIFVCISPWNFPLAIYLGQITAALMAGNAVIAKPAEQTPLIAARVAELIYEAGVLDAAFSFLPGDGQTGAAIVSHPRVCGVAFTGSTAAAQAINRNLAAKDGAIVPLIAETGGQNAMIVDSSALPEQVIDDVINSAFGSAGQRCSALRILYVQDDIADHLIEMLRGAMEKRIVANPLDAKTDIGPVIDEEALKMLHDYRENLDNFGKFIGEVPLPDHIRNKGYFFAPCAYEIDSIDQLGGEIFGPVLHVIRFKSKNLDLVIDRINQSGYGLTFGLHTRIASRISAITDKMNVGNAYINRAMTGAVVGVQPFGGYGLSGTGPKAGGPHYLIRFGTEKVVSIDTTRQGGNASLVSLEE